MLLTSRGLAINVIRDQSAGLDNPRSNIHQTDYQSLVAVGVKAVGVKAVGVKAGKIRGQVTKTHFIFTLFFTLIFAPSQ